MQPDAGLSARASARPRSTAERYAGRYLRPHLLEQPWDALRPRVVQVVHHDHHGSAFGVGRGNVADSQEAFCGPAAERLQVGRAHANALG